VQNSVTTAEWDSKTMKTIIRMKKKNEKLYLNVLTAEKQIMNQVQATAMLVDTALKVDNHL
jgi:uncharacterized protein (UPF0335 family)